jgi:hypothetical protein
MDRQAPSATSGLRTNLWMFGAGYLIWNERLQPAFRIDGVILDDKAPNPGLKSNIASIGLNYYKKGHSLKLQGDLSFASGTGDAVDAGRVQAQVDF